MAKIAVVDDDASVVDACRLFLEREGHEVVFAYSREDGMRLVTQSPPDLLILDVMMEWPDDGIAMAQELRHNGFKTPIMMLTSVGKATGLDYGKDDLMVPVDLFEEKPITPARLIQQVNKLLEKKEN